MFSIQATEEEVSKLLQQHPSADIAGLNGPMSTVISGDAPVVEALAREFEARGRKVKQLVVSHAFHSHHMDPILSAFRDVAATVEFHAPTIPLVSNVTGEFVAPEEICTPDYWVRHIRSAVRFLDGVRALEGRAAGVMLELGPRGVLSAMAAGCLSEAGQRDIELLSAQRRDRPETETLAATWGGLHCLGVKLDLEAYFKPFAPRKAELPTYSFQRKRFWLEPTVAPETTRGPELTADFWSTVHTGDVAGLCEMLDIHGQADQTALSGILPFLSSWHGQRALGAQLNACRYEIYWTPVAPACVPSHGLWLLVLPPAGVEESMTRALVGGVEAMGAKVASVTLCSEMSEDDISQALATTIASSQPEVILSLLALDESDYPGSPAMTTGLALNFLLARALAVVPSKALLWLMTKGAVTVDGAQPLASPLQVTTWGLGQTLSLEQTRHWGGLVDVPIDCSEQLLADIGSKLTRGDAEDALALRPNGVFARRLRRRHSSASIPATSRTGTAMITGGTGALGAHVAQWLIQRGIEHLALVSRSGPQAPGSENLRAQLVAQGVGVSIIACDVSKRDDIERLLNSLADVPPLKIIVHAAGVAGDVNSIENTTLEQYATTLSAKILGARYLDELTRGFDLDAFIMFASIAGIWGSGGQAAYSSGNAFLDALAVHRVQQGLPGTSIAWGPWAQGGMADADGGAEYLSRRGLHLLEPSLATAALDLSLVEPNPTVVVADVEWQTFAESYSATRPRPLIAEFAPASQESTPDVTPSTHVLVHELRGLAPSERLTRIIDLVVRETRAITGAAESDDLDPNTGFSDLGLDSLMSVELRRRLHHVTGLGFPATLAFDYPSPRRLGEFILSELGDEFVTQDTRLDDYSDSQVRDLLSGIPLAKLKASGLLQQLLTLVDKPPTGAAASGPVPDEMDDLDFSGLLEVADSLLGDDDDV